MGSLLAWLSPSGLVLDAIGFSILFYDVWLLRWGELGGGWLSKDAERSYGNEWRGQGMTYVTSKERSRQYDPEDTAARIAAEFEGEIDMINANAAVMEVFSQHVLKRRTRALMAGYGLVIAGVVLQLVAAIAAALG